MQAVRITNLHHIQIINLNTIKKHRKSKFFVSGAPYYSIGMVQGGVMLTYGGTRLWSI
jgi:hypothetical protein